MCKYNKSSPLPPLLYHSLLIPLLKVSNLKYFSVSCLFKYGNRQVCQAVAWQVEVSPCGSTYNLVGNVSSVVP